MNNFFIWLSLGIGTGMFAPVPILIVNELNFLSLPYMAAGRGGRSLPYGALSSPQIVTALSGKSYGLGLTLGDGAFALSGGTNEQDLQTQLQLFTAFIRDPGFRPEAFEQFRQQSIGRMRSADATPQGVMGLKSAELLRRSASLPCP